MHAEFFPLYAVLIAGSLIAGALAIRWTWKLREGTLHLLEQWPAARDHADRQAEVKADDSALLPQ